MEPDSGNALSALPANLLIYNGAPRGLRPDIIIMFISDTYEIHNASKRSQKAVPVSLQRISTRPSLVIDTNGTSSPLKTLLLNTDLSLEHHRCCTAMSTPRTRARAANFYRGVRASTRSQRLFPIHSKALS